MTADEMEAKINALSTSVDEQTKTFEASKKDYETKIKTLEADIAKKAGMDDKDDDKDKDKKKDAATLKAEEDDMKKKKEEKDAAMVAELTLLRNAASQPKIAFLSAAYKNRIGDEDLKTMSASWAKMDLGQLDAEIIKVKPFIKVQEHSANTEPVGFSTHGLPAEFSAGVKDPKIKEIDDMTVTELFSGVRS